MKVYLAGPMRGIRGFNFPAFMRAAADLEALGLEVFNPAQHDVDNGFTFEGATGNEDLSALGFNLRRALGDDLAYICHEADAVVVLPGWEQSSGANAEVATALALGLMVWQYDVVCAHHAILARIDQRGQDQIGRHDGTTPLLDSLDDAAEAAPVLVNADTGEVRVTADTGGEKGSKPQRFDLIPVRPLWLLAELYGKGAEKYAERNWERGYPWHLSFAAAMRHMWKFWGGEYLDPETGIPHPICAVFHMLALVEFVETHPEFDDRATARATT